MALGNRCAFGLLVHRHLEEAALFACRCASHQQTPLLEQPVTSSIKFTSFALSALLCWAAPAHANLWMMIYTDGEKPTRSVYYADFTNIDNRSSPADFMAELERTGDPAKAEANTAIKQIRVNQVQESASAPYVTNYTLEFRCIDKQFRITEKRHFYRHNGHSELVPGHHWQALAEPWHAQSLLLACEPSRWQHALEADRKRGRGQDALGQLGLVVVGQFVFPSELHEFSFATLWRDGVKPTFTTDKSKEELERLRQETIAKAGQVKAELQQKEQAVQRDITASQQEQEFMASIDRKFASKTYPKAFQDLMISMKGWSEKDLIDTWGLPDVERTVGERRLWVYYQEQDERQTYVVSKHGHTASYGDLRTCELTLVLGQGGKQPGDRLVDYQMDGSHCNVDTLTKRVRRP